ncbi:MAG TPA: hypothetical protein VI306_18745 [Pyrinomonadaceae bacterium]
MKKPRIQIENLHIKAAGLSPEQGRQLARLVARNLARVPVSRTGVVKNLNVSHQSKPATSIASLADQVVDQITRKIK